MLMRRQCTTPNVLLIAHDRTEFSVLSSDCSGVLCLSNMHVNYCNFI